MHVFGVSIHIHMLQIHSRPTIDSVLDDKNHNYPSKSGNIVVQNLISKTHAEVLSVALCNDSLRQKSYI